MLFPSDEGRRQILRPGIITALVTGGVFLTCYLIGLPWESTIMLAGAVGWMTVRMARQTRHSGQPAVLLGACGGAIITGSLGMLLGWTLDLNRLGLYALLETCRAARGPDFNTLWLHLTNMPWSYAGMFVFSNVGMLVVKTSYWNGGPMSAGFSDWIGRNAAMVLGMLTGGVIASDVSASFHPKIAAATMLALMVTGMGVGMGSFHLLARMLARCWKDKGVAIGINRFLLRE